MQTRNMRFRNINKNGAGHDTVVHAILKGMNVRGELDLTGITHWETVLERKKTTIFCRRKNEMLECLLPFF